MNIIISRRFLTRNKSTFSNISKLKNIVLSSHIPEVPTATGNKNNLRTTDATKSKKVKQRKKLPNVPIVSPWVKYNESYNLSYGIPALAAINNANRFFNKADVKFEWSVGDFNNIPSEIVKSKFQDIKPNLESPNAKRFPGKTAIPFDLISGLPEIVFLGRSNAGKSTILNNLVTQYTHNNLNDAARVSNKPGFTKTLNCFNIANKLRLIDTPGYGFGSRGHQGDLTMEYIQNREELVRCYVLVSANQGFTQLDLEVVNYLKEIGKPFEVIFTKMDKVKDLNKFKEMIEETGITAFPSLPRLIFTNSLISNKCPRRYGIDVLRNTILESCGLSNVN